MKKIITVVLSAAMIVAMLAACGSSSAETTATTTQVQSADSDESASTEAGGETSEETSTEVTYDINYDSEIIVGVSADIGSMNQFGASSSGVAIKKLLCYETLFYKNPEGELLPLLGKEYTSDGNGKYTVELFDYITDSMGNPFTASDVVFSIDQLKTQPTQSDLWSTIVDYKAVDDYTFEIILDPETTGQLSDIFSRVSMITEAAYNASPDAMASEPVGTGGYVLDLSSSVTGATYTFIRRDDYWQTDEEYLTERNGNYIAKLICKVYTDTSTLATGLETGEIDFTSDLEVNGLSFFTDGENPYPGYVQMRDDNNAFVHLMFNCADSSPCHDQNLREAICYAIDAAGCAMNVYGSYGQVCMAPTNPNLEDSGHEFDYDEYFNYDTDKAKELLGKSDYKGETVKILVLPRTTVSGSAVLIQNYLQAIGINSELLEYDMSVFRTKRVEADPEYDIELLGATSGDSYVYTSVKELNANTYSNGLSRIMIEDDKLQELFEAVGNQETDSPEAVKALFDHLTDNCYIYGMYYADKTLIGKDNIIPEACTVVPFFGPLFNTFVITD